VNALKAPAALALIAVLLAGCGGGGDRAKVEDTIQNALNNLDPAQRTAFPIGAGPPRVKQDSCKSTQKPPVRINLPAQIHVHGPRLPKGLVLPRPPKHLAYWSCVVRFAHTPFHVRVALEDNGTIFWAMLLPRQVLRPGTATTYQGGPEQPKP
jgi:hypothetical protein